MLVDICKKYLSSLKIFVLLFVKNICRPQNISVNICLTITITITITITTNTCNCPTHSRLTRSNHCCCKTLVKKKRNYEQLLTLDSVFIPAGMVDTKNIARGTTDPEIDSVTWTKFGNNMAPLALVANLATRWRHLH